MTREDFLGLQAGDIIQIPFGNTQLTICKSSTRHFGAWTCWVQNGTPEIYEMWLYMVNSGEGLYDAAVDHKLWSTGFSLAGTRIVEKAVREDPLSRPARA